jgi:hypothetical protein
MNRQSKGIGAVMLVTAVGVGFSAMCVAFLYGLPRASFFVYRFANPFASGMFALDLLILPLAIFKRIRPIVGGVVLASSYVFGIVLWLFSAMVTYAFWGSLGLVIGLFLMGIGVVPTALLAALLNSSWILVMSIIGECLCIWGTRALGVFLVAPKRAQVALE